MTTLASNPVLQQFLQESREGLEGIAASLLALERAPDDGARMDELFRVVHTLKGNCGLFDFPDMFRVIHAAEDLMSAVRAGQIAFGGGMADALLDAMDFVAQQMDDIDVAGRPGNGHTAAAALTARLRALVPAAAAGAGDMRTPVEAAAPQSARMAAALTLAEPAVRAACADPAAAGAAPLWVEYAPEPECFFKGEDPLYQALQLPGVVWRRVTTADAWPAAAQLDPYRCNLLFQAVTTAPRAAVEEHFRYVPEQVWIAPVEPPAAPCADPERAAEAFAIVRAQGEALAPDDGAPWVPGRVLAALATIRGCLRAIGRADLLDDLEVCVAAALEDAAATPLLAWIERHTQGAAAAPPPPVPVAQPEAEPKFGRRADDQPAGRILKVEQAKVDRLMNLIGEMVVARNGLPYLAGRAENQYGARELAREIKAQHAVINRIVDEMQDAIMQVRMTPMSFVFQRFPRLVRDIARRLGKEVELVLEGETTEADKNVIEALADPLVHIVRNALDHGMEQPDERRAAGKPAAGRLVLAARQEADRVVIEVADDGRGIDPARIRQKAHAKGLVDEAQLGRMSDQEAVNLVFLPGFSTAEAVSDLSGRGVGMDAVRSAVDGLNGTVQLTSVAGRGTRLQLTLPLSMAVSSVMIVESGGARYGVPMDLVVETVRVPAGAVHAIGQREAAVLRGRIVPLRGLNELLLLPDTQRRNDADELAVLVLRVQGQNLGLVIDDFCGVMEVILKPMAGILGSLATYAGSALLGDGSVLMVINPKELLQ
ncbi:chemotaxis protein CheA [Massilia putida]|uniref:chemotaxis protein CheA n=1 Tax=Massilia putida TaxID=1141883 RepID=UPI0009533B6D|nr:chemotaxis protein CheA [Massilia putida]